MNDILMMSSCVPMPVSTHPQQIQILKQIIFKCHSVTAMKGSPLAKGIEVTSKNDF